MHCSEVTGVESHNNAYRQNETFDIVKCNPPKLENRT